MTESRRSRDEVILYHMTESRRIRDEVMWYPGMYPARVPSPGTCLSGACYTVYRVGARRVAGTNRPSRHGGPPDLASAYGLGSVWSLVIWTSSRLCLDSTHITIQTSNQG